MTATDLKKWACSKSCRQQAVPSSSKQQWHLPTKNNAAIGYPDVSPPFVAACVHGDDPVAQAEKWRQRIPHLSNMAYKWIAEGGFTAKPIDETPIDEPRRSCTPEAQIQVDKAIRKSIQVGSSRLWDRDREGAPTFCTPVGAVPKKDSTETWRFINDYHTSNAKCSTQRTYLARRAYAHLARRRRPELDTAAQHLVQARQTRYGTIHE
eukprot:COSAG01_NODE_21655_length_891_cov_2.810606_1_plen_208_part_00